MVVDDETDMRILTKINLGHRVLDRKSKRVTNRLLKIVKFDNTSIFLFDVTKKLIIYIHNEIRPIHNICQNLSITCLADTQGPFTKYVTLSHCLCSYIGQSFISVRFEENLNVIMWRILQKNIFFIYLNKA